MGTIKTGFANILFSKARQRVLAVLYGQPDRGFYTNAIIRLTHSGSGAVQRELEKLAAAGFITIKQVGNQKHYQANHASPLFSELRSIVLKTFGLADVLRQALKPVAAKIHIAFIYGSVAKQQDTAESDIDLMLFSDKLTYADVFPLLAKVESNIGRPVNPTIYSLVELARKLKKDNNFLMQVLKQPKIFLIGTEDELGKFK